MRTPVTVGVVGSGARARMLAGVVHDLQEADLRWICEPAVAGRPEAAVYGADVRVTADLDQLLEDEGLDAVLLATQSGSEPEIVRCALDADKHVLVMASLARQSEQAGDLVRRARRRHRRLLVSHSLLLDPAVEKLKELIQLGRLGDVFYVTGELRSPQTSHDVLWCLGSDQVSLLLHLLGDQPIEAVALSESYVRAEAPELLVCYLRFATGIAAVLELSSIGAPWTRRLTVVGSERTAVLEDVETERRLALHEAGTHSWTTLRFADGSDLSLAPVSGTDLCRAGALSTQLQQFVSAIRSPVPDGADGREGAAVVSVLEALDRSLGRQGLAEAVSGDTPEGAVIPLTVRSA